MVIPHPIVAAAAGYEGTVCPRNDIAKALSIYGNCELNRWQRESVQKNVTVLEGKVCETCIEDFLGPVGNVCFGNCATESDVASIDKPDRREEGPAEGGLGAIRQDDKVRL